MNAPPYLQSSRAIDSPRPYGARTYKSWIDSHHIVILILPWLAFLVNPNWIFQGFGHMDPWYYFGMSIDFPGHQHLLATYSGERLTWILPARLFVALFSPVYGWLIFHLFIYWVSAFSIYALISTFSGRDAALVTTVMLGVHPMFLGSNGWTYLDSGSIAYLLLTFVALASSSYARNPRPYIVLAGMLWAATAYNYLLWWLLTPCCLTFYWATAKPVLIGRTNNRINWRPHATAVVCFLAGIWITTLLMITCHYAIHGAVSRSFYADSMAAAQFNLTVKKGQVYWGSESYDWAVSAGWIVFPILTFVLSTLAMAGHILGRRLPRLTLGLILTFDYAFLALVYLTFRPNQILQFDYYASILIPMEFLVLGVLAFTTPQGIAPRTLAVVLGIAILISLAPLWRGWTHTFGLQREHLLWNYLAGTVAVLIAITSNRKSTCVAAVIGLAIASCGLTPRFPSTAWNWHYDGLAAMKRVSEAVSVVDANTSIDKLPVFWLDNFQDPYTAEYRAIVCALRTHSLAMNSYPEVDTKRKYSPGTELIIITRDPREFKTANASLTAAGMPLRLRTQHKISGEGYSAGETVSYWLTFTEVRAPAPAEPAAVPAASRDR